MRSNRRMNRWLYRCWRGMRWLLRKHLRRSRRPSLGSLRRYLLGLTICFGGCLRIGDTLQMMTNPLGNFDGDRTGMSLLLGYPKTRQKVNNCFGLHLEFTGEFINADLG